MAYAMVVIGASVGGLEAIRVLLHLLPAGFSLPIAIAQHRAPAPPDGDLAAVWQRASALPVADAQDKGTIEPGHVYVAPADYHLLVESRGHFALSTDSPVLFARPSIDVLFESAAEAYGSDVIGVILTGASADGSRGLKAVRERGGCALVQEPDTAESGVMPRAALAATPVDHVMEIQALGRMVAQLGQGARP